MAKMKDSPTRFPLDAEHAVVLPGELVVALRLRAADMAETQADAGWTNRPRLNETLARKACHKHPVLVDLLGRGIRNYSPEADRATRIWGGKDKEQHRVDANRRRLSGSWEKTLHKLRSHLAKGGTAEMHETGSIGRMILAKSGNLRRPVPFPSVASNLVLLLDCHVTVRFTNLPGISNPTLLLRIAMAAFPTYPRQFIESNPFAFGLPCFSASSTGEGFGSPAATCWV
jgi:hypothetical protein